MKGMERMSMRRPMLISSIMVAAVSVTAFVLVAGPLHGRIVAENDEIQKSNAKVENDRRSVSRLPEYREQSAVIDADSPELRLLLPEDKVVDFIRETESVAKGVGGSVAISKGKDLGEISKQTAPSGAAKESGTASGAGLLKTLPEGKTLGLTLTFSGEYPDAVAFLHKVETSSYYLDVLSVDIRPAELSRDSARSDMFSAGIPEGVSPASVSGSVQAVFEIVIYLE